MHEFRTIDCVPRQILARPDWGGQPPNDADIAAWQIAQKLLTDDQLTEAGNNGYITLDAGGIPVRQRVGVEIPMGVDAVPPIGVVGVGPIYLCIMHMTNVAGNGLYGSQIDHLIANTLLAKYDPDWMIAIGIPNDVIGMLTAFPRQMTEIPERLRTRPDRQRWWAWNYGAARYYGNLRYARPDKEPIVQSWSTFFNEAAACDPREQYVPRTESELGYAPNGPGLAVVRAREEARLAREAELQRRREEMRQPGDLAVFNFDALID